MNPKLKLFVMKNFTLPILALVFSMQLHAQERVFNYDTIDFESPTYYLSIDTSSANVWQVCKPNKTFFDSAYSADSAIVTNCIGFYPDTNHSYFDLYITYENHPGYPADMFYEFKHKYHTENGLDGGYISVSFDMGDSWINIIDEPEDNFWDELPGFDSYNLYTSEDTLFNGEYGFSGNSKDWITTEFSWLVIPVTAEKSAIGDTMIMRFNFISDSSSSDHEGWMIDDIRLFSIEVWGIDDLNASMPVEVYPNPANSELYIELDREYQRIDVEVFDMAGKRIGRYHFAGTDRFSLDCSAMKDGMYLLRTTLDSDYYKYKKLIIRR